jgi:hypothetical protein
MNAILGKQKVGVVKNTSDKCKPNVHQFFNEAQPCTNQDKNEHQSISRNNAPC